MNNLTFLELAAKNARRCEESFHRIEMWSETDWMTAVAGEVGEAANLIKKRRRLSTPNNTQEKNYNAELHINNVIDELADAVIYIDLLCTRMGGNLEEGIRRKFKEVSKRVGSVVELYEL